MRPRHPLTAEERARKAYPHRGAAQVHFVRGYRAEMGDPLAHLECVGSHAEHSGRMAAREVPS